MRQLLSSTTSTSVGSYITSIILVQCPQNKPWISITENDPKSLPVQIGTRDFVHELVSSRQIPDAMSESTAVEVVDDGHCLTLPFLNQMGFSRPILVRDQEGLDLEMPSSEDLDRVQDVPSLISDPDAAKVDVINVFSQDTTEMSLKVRVIAPEIVMKNTKE